MQKGGKMGRLIDEDDAIRIVEFECGEWIGLARTISRAIQRLPSAQPDFDTVEKIDKAYDDGYKCGYLQAKSDYEAEMRGEQE